MSKSDTTTLQNSALAICCRSLRTEQITQNSTLKVRDIDQTDLHRSEPSSRTLLWDEHSHQ